MDITKLISSMDFLSDRGYGSSGFLNEFHKIPILLDKNTILTYFKGYYLHPFGGLLKREIAISATILRDGKKYEVSYKFSFWDNCSESKYIKQHLVPFFTILQNYINGCIEDKSYYANYAFYSKNLDEKEKEQAKRDFLIAQNNKTYEY